MEGEIEVFTGVEPNPSTETVERGADAISDFEPGIVLAVGGGSVMDAAKFMAVIGRHGGKPYDYAVGGRIPPDGGYPLYAVPTTPGTSSEITPFAVVTLNEVSNKVGLRHPSIYPRGAIIDPSLTLSLPRDQTAATGFDILSHAVESYWSIHSDPMTRQFSARSVALVKEHLEGAVRNGSSRRHREGLSLASVFAGLAFSNTGTTICHSISYPITYDSDLPHGMAVALTLGPTFDMLKKKGFEGLSPLASALGTDVRGFSDELRSLMESVGAPTRLSQIGFQGGVDRIISTDMSPLMRNMPVQFDEEDVRSIIEDVL
jgi:alcohol dehydrogenase